MAQMQCVRRRTATRVQVKGHTLFVEVEDFLEVAVCARIEEDQCNRASGVESRRTLKSVPVRKEEATAKPRVCALAGQLLHSLDQCLPPQSGRARTRSKPTPHQCAENQTCQSTCCNRYHRPCRHEHPKESQSASCNCAHLTKEATIDVPAHLLQYISPPPDFWA